VVWVVVIWAAWVEWAAWAVSKLSCTWPELRLGQLCLIKNPDFGLDFFARCCLVIRTRLNRLSHARACTVPAWVFVLSKIRHSGAAQALGLIDAVSLLRLLGLLGGLRAL
jgi:hypothetical protein